MERVGRKRHSVGTRAHCRVCAALHAQAAQHRNAQLCGVDPTQTQCDPAAVVSVEADDDSLRMAETFLRSHCEDCPVTLAGGLVTPETLESGIHCGTEGGFAPLAHASPRRR